MARKITEFLRNAAAPDFDWADVVDGVVEAVNEISDLSVRRQVTRNLQESLPQLRWFTTADGKLSVDTR